MKAITKGPEPKSLTQHRSSEHCNYENYGAKDELRRTLVAEQQGLCCYCMGRIRPEAGSMKVEHWKCQSRYPEHELTYRNLLGACLGGDDQPRRKQHCATRKRDDDLLWNPAEPAHAIEAKIRYKLDGSIFSDNTNFNQQLNQVLNLNLPKIKNNRKLVLDAVVRWLKAEKARLQGPVPRERLQRKIDRTAQGPELAPYCQVTIWWLQQRLSRMS